MKCYLTDDADEFYLLLSSSQELSFKCWENLVITPADKSCSAHVNFDTIFAYGVSR
jgi:hypothetical protein